AREPGLRAARRRSAAGGGAARDARGDRLPGPGARGGDGARRFLDRRGGRAAPGDEPQAVAGGDRGVPRAVRRGRGRERGRGGGRGRGLRQARRLLGLRLPEIARGGIRAARVPVGMAAAPLSGRVPVRAAERAADGLLPAVLAGARRAAARGGGAAAGGERQRGGERARGRGRPRRAVVRSLAGGGGGEGGRGGAGAGGAVPGGAGAGAEGGGGPGR